MTAKTDNKPVAVSGDLVVSPYPTSAELRTAIRSGSRLSIESTDGDGTEMLLRALDAKSVEELAGGDLVKAKEILGVPLALVSFEGLRESDFDDSSLGVWAIFRAVTPEGEVVTVGVGAADPVVKLVKLHELGAFEADNPPTVKFEQSSKPTAAGFYPMNLVIVKRVETADGQGF